MLNLIKTNIKICLNNKKYIICFLIFFSILMYAYIDFALDVYGKTSINLMKNYKMGIIKERGSIGAIKDMIMLSLPLLSCVFYSDIIMYEKETGVISFNLVRCTYNKYIISKCISVAVINFFTIFLPIAFVELLVWITIPDIGVISGIHLPVYQTLGIREMMFWNDLFYYNPYIYNMLIIFIISLYASIIGVMALSISLLIPKLKRIYFAILIFLTFNIIEIFLPIEYQVYTFIQIYPTEPEELLKIMSGWILVSIILFIFGIRNERSR